MLNVDKNYSDSSYVDQYWKNNLIIDSNIYKHNVEHNNSYDSTQNRGYYQKQYGNIEHNLSTKTRVEEYNFKDIKILLDSFSKPKLLLESSRKAKILI